MLPKGWNPKPLKWCNYVCVIEWECNGAVMQCALKLELFKGICTQLPPILLEHRDPNGLLELPGNSLVAGKKKEKKKRNQRKKSLGYSDLRCSLQHDHPLHFLQWPIGATVFQSHFITHINAIGLQYWYLLLSGSQSSQAHFITSVNHLISC